MPHVELTTKISAPVERCFDLSCSIDVHIASMASSRERALAGVTSGLITLGQEVTWEARHFGVRWRVTTRITALERPWRFVDEMTSGPFASFRHEHRFEQDNPKGTLMIDVVEYRSPLGPLGAVADAIVVERYLRHLLTVRNDFVKATAEGAGFESYL